MKILLGTKNKGKLNYSETSSLLYELSVDNSISDKMQNDYGITVQNNLNYFDKTMDLDYQTQLLKAEYGEKAWDNTELIGNVKKFSRRNIFVDVAKFYVSGYKEIAGTFKRLYDSYKARKSFGKLPPASGELEQTTIEMSNGIDQNGMLSSLVGMVKNEEEIATGIPTKRTMEIEEQDWSR